MASETTVKSLIKDIRFNISQGKYDDALPLLKHLLKKDPKSVLAFLYLGFCFLKMDQLEKAEVAFDRGLTVLDELGDRTLEGELSRGYLECIFRLEDAKSSMEDVISENDTDSLEKIYVKKSNLYDRIRSRNYLKFDDVKWWRMYVDLYIASVSSIKIAKAQFLKVYYPMEDNILKRIEGIKEMLMLWEKNESIVSIVQEQITVPEEITRPIKTRGLPLHKFRLIQNMLQYLQQAEDDRIKEEVQVHMKDFEAEKKKEAIEKFMKKRKCSFNEATMLLHGEIFVTKQERSHEQERYRDQLRKEYTMNNNEWDLYFNELMNIANSSEFIIPMDDYNTYLYRLYARMCKCGTSEDPEERSHLMDRLSEITSLAYLVLKRFRMSFLSMKLLLTLRECDQWNNNAFEDMIGKSSTWYFDQLRRDIVAYFPHETVSQVIYAQHILKSDIDEETISRFDTYFQDTMQRYPYVIEVWVNYSKLWYQQSKYKLASKLARKGLDAIETREKFEGLQFNSLRNELKTILCKSLFAAEQYSEAEEICKEVLRSNKNSISALKILAHIARFNGNANLSKKLFERVIELSNDAEALCELGWIYYQEGNIDKAEELLKLSYAKNELQYLAPYRLGLLYWNKGGEYRTDKSYAYNFFLASAKKNPTLSSNFAYIGHHFYYIEKDYNKAQKCYQKAVIINPLEYEAGENLASIYENTNQGELAIELFQEVVEKNPRAQWAWKRLGYHHLHQGEYESALKSFQFALRADTTDSMTWEGLAETYQKQGKYLAASKAYQKCYQIDNSSVYSLCQLGVMSHLLGSLNEACVTFQSVIEQDPTFVLGYTGLAEALFDKAKDYYENGVLVMSAVNIICAANVLEVFVKQNDSFKLVWKLFGDICCFFFHLPDKSINEANNKLLQKEVSISVALPLLIIQNLRALSKEEALKTSSLAYSKLVSLVSSNSDHHFDLGISYAYQYYNLLQNNEVDTKLRDMAVESIQYAIRLSPKFAFYWNCLGCIVEDDLIRQHCFIKAIEKNSKYSSPWNNLGALYMKYGQYNLARKAFANAQSISPKDAYAWVGLAIINEYNLLLDENYKERLDSSRSAYLFSWSIKNSLPASLGSAYTAYLSNNFLDACHCLMKYFQIDEGSMAAWNIFGMSLYSLGQIERADAALSKAYELSKIPVTNEQRILSENAIKIPFASDSVPISKIIARNYATVLCRQGKFEEAVRIVDLSELHSDWIAISKGKQSNATLDPEDKLKLALFCVQRKNWKLAIDILEEFTSINSFDIDALELLAISYSMVFGIARGESFLVGIIKRSSSTISSQQMVDIHIRLSKLLLSNMDPCKALHYCFIARRITPSSHELLVTMLRCVLHPAYQSNQSDRFELLELLCNQGFEMYLGEMLRKCNYDKNLAYVTYILVGAGYLLVGSSVDSTKRADIVRRCAQNAYFIYPQSKEAAILRIAASTLCIEVVENSIDLYLQQDDISDSIRTCFMSIHAQQLIRGQQFDSCEEFIAQCLPITSSAQDKGILLTLKAISQYLRSDMDYYNSLSNALSHSNGDLNQLLVAASFLFVDGKYDTVYRLLSSTPEQEVIHSLLSYSIMAMKLFSILVLLDSCKGKERSSLLRDASNIGNELIHFYNLSGISYFLLGLVKDLEGDKSSAEKMLSNATMREPNIFFANEYLYRLYYEQENWDASHLRLLKEHDLRPQNVTILFWLADFAFQSELLDQALEWIKKTLAIDPSHKDALTLQQKIEKKIKSNDAKQQSFQRGYRR